LLAMNIVSALVVLALLLVSMKLPTSFFPGTSTRLPVSVRLGMIYATVFMLTICSRFFDPASFALLGEIVEEAQLTRASSFQQLSWSLSLLLGPAIASLLFLAFGPSWALLIDVMSFVVSFLTIRAIAVLRAESSIQTVRIKRVDRALKELMAGVRFYLKSRILLTVTFTWVVVMLGGGAFETLQVFFVIQNLHAPVTTFGLMGTLNGLGSLVGAMLVGILTRRLPTARIFWGGAFGMGVILLTLSRLTTVLPVLGLMALLGICNSAVSIASAPLTLHGTPRQLVGRVTALLHPVVSVSSLLSVVVAGYLASTVLRHLHAHILGMTFGAIDTIFAAAGALMLVAGLLAAVGLHGVRLSGEASVTTTAVGAMPGA
ncbi:MAG: MFS transporter, partial [Ktedonobacterales bacterium]